MMNPPDPDTFPPHEGYETDSEGDGGGNDGDEGYSSALEDQGGMQLAALQRELPPGTRIPPQRITPAVARARWQARLDPDLARLDPNRARVRKVGAKSMRPT